MNETAMITAMPADQNDVLVDVGDQGVLPVGLERR